jgi:adenylate cyclase
MAVEIERKFLVRGEDWRKHATSRALLRQAHLARVCRLGAGCEGLMGLRHSGLIEKTRFTVRWQGSLWEVDVFSGDNSGLVIAEIELRHESEPFDRPPWLGIEVTGQSQYYNGSLPRRPLHQVDCIAILEWPPADHFNTAKHGGRTYFAATLLADAGPSGRCACAREARPHRDQRDRSGISLLSQNVPCQPLMAPLSPQTGQCQTMSSRSKSGQISSTPGHARRPGLRRHRSVIASS